MSLVPNIMEDVKNRIPALVMGSRLCRLLCGKAQPFRQGRPKEKDNKVFQLGRLSESRRLSAQQAEEPRFLHGSIAAAAVEPLCNFMHGVNKYEKDHHCGGRWQGLPQFQRRFP